MPPKTPIPQRETGAMVALMNPAIAVGEVVFCTTTDERTVESARTLALGSFREAEGVTLILPRAEAEALGFPVDIPMRRITLAVHSALDGVGLTAAVASVLAAEAIPCNVVAAFHHDHVFVPSGTAERALAILKALQVNAALRAGLKG